ncbi:Mini-ribonuclease 3 [Leuconostoc mesenteroides]|uniref:Mini-ribonuclease 3 n=1 Tax=Leuconostoc mesenteroides TaxID=1245 RepID=A0A843Z2R5_LEUME|nr:Mini-ribonuclease 3 [Leuconostoc mesenteroides]ARN64242.1 Mini-ribonuclease 3 [Leuconostoc mesenteroides subsp. mesenteroides]MBZ1514938.1 Mini-ribonuclease 3 [Leuconostoc mesenteroides]MBZ1519306.1 Mini-ribonuclease 3 [Leuconostoc mesenteroides]MBZ1521135.1 Mini-ribonuclease 3 [Leuconostoc mesenteroides]MBZ1523561.1 Mini-ribonuclease 3 [Leuconostoc mesenteroides]
MHNLNYRQMNGLSLAYIGDAIYELEVRRHFLSLGLTKVNELQKRSKHYVSAKAHAALFEQMMVSNILTDDELDYFKRGRNAKSHTKAKNTDVITYRISTGVEALFGYLYMSEQHERILELMTWIFEQVETGSTNK